MSTALTDTSKLLISFKKVLGKAQTSNSKGVSNEGIGSNITMGASTVFGYAPPTPVSSSYYTILGGVAEKVSLAATPIAGTKDDNGRYQAFALSLPADYQANSSNPNKGSGFYVNGQVLNETTGTLQIIPPSFGADYTALAYHTSSAITQIPALDARDWILDYFNGIFFQQDPPADSDENPAFVDAFIYIGDYALTRLSGSGGAPGGSTTQVQFNDATSFGGSSNLTFNGTTLTGSYTGSVAEVTTLSASLVNVEPLSGTMAGPGSYLSLDVNNNVVLATGDGATTSPGTPVNSIQFNNAGAFGGSSDLTYDGSTVSIKGASHLSGGLAHKRTGVTNDYSVVLTDYYLGVDTTGNTVELTLPAASTTTEGQTYVVKDEGGNAAANIITIVRSASDTIDGETSATIESPYGSLLLYSNGSHWFIY